MLLEAITAILIVSAKDDLIVESLGNSCVRAETLPLDDPEIKARIDMAMGRFNLYQIWGYDLHLAGGIYLDEISASRFTILSICDDNIANSSAEREFINAFQNFARLYNETVISEQASFRQ